MKLITFYADCKLPDKAQRNQNGFDWRNAIKMLEKSAAKFGYEVLVVTDEHTDIQGAWLRTGDAKADGIMMWLLKAQAAAVESFQGDMAVMVSPDTLIYKSLDFLFGNFDLSILTREKPKAIVNSVIGFRPSPAVSALWRDFVIAAESLSDDSKHWGADIDALVQVLSITPGEIGLRTVAGVRAKFIPVAGHFQSVARLGVVKKMHAPIWDFKGPRKSMMRAYARLLNAHI